MNKSENLQSKEEIIFENEIVKVYKDKKAIYFEFKFYHADLKSKIKKAFATRKWDSGKKAWVIDLKEEHSVNEFISKYLNKPIKQVIVIYLDEFTNGAILSRILTRELVHRISRRKWATATINAAHALVFEDFNANDVIILDNTVDNTEKAQKIVEEIAKYVKERLEEQNYGYSWSYLEQCEGDMRRFALEKLNEIKQRLLENKLEEENISQEDIMLLQELLQKYGKQKILKVISTL